MKIGFYSHLGEAKEPVARAWAVWLRQNGHDVVFVSPAGGYGRIPAVRDFRLVKRSLNGLDAVVACDVWSLSLLVWPCRKREIKKVYSCFELYSEIVPWNWKVRLERKGIEWLERNLMSSDWQWLYGNKERLDFYQTKYSGEGGKVIPNYPMPIDLDRFRRRGALKSILLVGTVNNRIPVSDLRFVAWYCVQNDIKLVVAGSIDRSFSQLENYPSVKLLPYAKGVDYLNLLNESSLGLATYVKEGKNYELCAPVKVYDYLFSGMPFLTSNQETLKSLAVRTSSMLTYESGDFSSLHAQLDEFRLNWGRYASKAMENASLYRDAEDLFGRSLRDVFELD